MTIVYPEPFLEVRCRTVSPLPPTMALCAGYEGGNWRSARFADHLFNWLPFAALNQEHQHAFNASNFVEMLRRAAAHVYNMKKTEKRGEIGELMLHLACILNFKTVPVLCKLLLKTSPNETIKGFDGVHLCVNGDDFEIWLGEAKFYTDPEAAILDAVNSIKNHILPSFLSTEKAMIFGHVAPDIPHRDQVLKLFKQQTSGDELLARAVFPVLIAYESVSVASHQAVVASYVRSLSKEVAALRDHFRDKVNGLFLRFEIVFVPLGKKGELVDEFDKRLGAFL